MSQAGFTSETGLAGAIRQICQASSAEELYSLLPRAARALTRGVLAVLLVRDGDQFEVVAEDSEQPRWQGQRFPLVDCVAGWSLRQHETVVIGDLLTDARITPEHLHGTALRSAVMVPLQAGRTEAVLGVYWTEAQTPRYEVQRVIEALAETTAVTLYNRQLLANRGNGKP